VHAPRGRELLGPDCESLFYAFHLDAKYTVRFPAYPVDRSASALWFAPACPTHPFPATPECESRVSVLEAGGGRRLLARGRMAWEERDPQPTRVALTPLGRRLIARRGGVVGTVVLHDYPLRSPLAWRIVLRL
jgi:hypothetical protein